MSRLVGTLAVLSAASSAVWVVFQLGFPWLPLLLLTLAGIAAARTSYRNRSAR